MMRTNHRVEAALAIAALIALSSCGGDGTGSGPVVATRSGRISGRGWSNGTNAWLGIPYAAPPVGELRWRAPQDPESWTGVRRADSFSSECVQYGGMLLDLDAETFGRVMGSEDCLYLNVWAPAEAGDRRPVFFWIHGGLNVVGEAATSLYHGANLARAAGMVVVTANYRLGTFGSFAHEALETGDPLDDSGAFGILDLIHALGWVRDNIEAFGGDPGNVTIAGESAGGYNVVSLLASPLAQGLFHRALSMSPASTLGVLPMEDGHRKADAVLVKLLGGGGLARSEADARIRLAAMAKDEVAAFLRSKSAEEIQSTAVPLSSLGLNEIGLTTEIFSASRYEDGTVIPLGYETLFERGEYNRVPYIVGSNTEEGRIFEVALGILSSLDEVELLDLIQSFEPGVTEAALDEIVSPATQPLYRAFGTLLADSYFQGTGVDPLAEDMSLHQDVYVYRFAWNDQPPPFDFLVGASHMMGLPFLFSNFQTGPGDLFRFAWSDENRAGAERLSGAFGRYVAELARSGNPGSGSPDLPVWQPWRDQSVSRSGRRLLLDTEIRMLPFPAGAD